MKFFKLPLQLLVVFSLLSFSFASWATNDGDRNTTTSPPSSSGGGDSSSNTGNAGLTSAMGILSAGINAGVGGMMAMECPGPPMQPMACAMAAMSFMQVAQSMMASGAADDTRRGYDTNNNGPPGTRDEFGPPGTTLDRDLRNLGVTDPKSLYAYSQAQLETLAKRGVKANPATGMVTMPNGKNVPFSAFSSVAGMVEAGATPEQAEKLLKMANAAADKYRVASVGVAGGGGSSSGTSYARAGSDPYADMYGYMNREKPNAAKTQGLARNLASGESIGTQTDSIFEMITRRYKQKNQENIFVAP